jgi:hypothetical protein
VAQLSRCLDSTVALESALLHSTPYSEIQQKQPQSSPLKYIAGGMIVGPRHHYVCLTSQCGVRPSHTISPADLGRSAISLLPICTICCSSYTSLYRTVVYIYRHFNIIYIFMPHVYRGIPPLGPKPHNDTRNGHYLLLIGIGPETN